MRAESESFTLFSPRRSPRRSARAERLRAFLFGAPMARKKTVEIVERTEICKECRAVHCSRTEGMRCRRYPPVFVYDPSTGASSAEWPEVNPDDWCAEFKPKLTS